MTKNCYFKRKLNKTECSLKKDLSVKRKKIGLKLFDRLRVSRKGLVTLVYAVSKNLLRLVSLPRAITKNKRF